jgi:ArsR family transcriptional regulator, lead/cadmium/zinc/bismuth-responsive transcriptional repressor
MGFESQTNARYADCVSDERCELLCLDLPLAEALRGARLAPELAERAAATARAFADPTRLTLAAALAGSEVELCACDLSWICERSEQLVGHHLRTLRRVGLVVARREGKMVLYRLTDEARALLRDVLEPAELPR